VIYLIGFKVERIFSKIDLRLQYHQVRIKEENITETTFRTRYGHYEIVVFLFGLSNALVVFMYLMNGVFREHVDKFLFFSWKIYSSSQIKRRSMRNT
jgi:hypothetical protein